MAYQFVIQADKDSFKEAERLLSGIPGGIQTASFHAANRTAATGKSIIVRRLSKYISPRGTLKTVKHGLDKNVYVHKANRKHDHAVIQVKSRGLNLIYFKPVITTHGVESAIKPVRPHAFAAIGLSDDVLIFERTGIKTKMKKGHYVGKRREKIKGVPGMSAQEVYTLIPGISQQISDELKTILNKNMKSQIDYLLNRKKAASE